MAKFKFTYEVSYDGTVVIQDRTLAQASEQFREVPPLTLIEDVSKANVNLLNVDLVPDNG